MSAVARAEAEARYPLRTSAGRDEKSWAKRFVYRYEHGDKTLMPVQIQFAYAALEMPMPEATARKG